jgi:F-type H+-transporting ATPase subunit a
MMKPTLGLPIFLAAILVGGALAARPVRAQEPQPSEHAPAGAEEPSAAPRHEHASPMSHVMDSTEWHFFDRLPAWEMPRIPGTNWKLTKFMVLEMIAAILVCAIYIPMARRLQRGDPPKGAWDNAFEVLLTFIRNDVAKEGIGEHDADRFVPFLWTMFLFILFSNLLGMLPFGASPTASIFVTAGLAVCVFFAIHGSAIAKMGFVHYLQSMWPHFDVPYGMGYVIKPLVFVIELNGSLVRNGVLAVRLFANMFAGHMVLATLLLFIVTATNVGFGLWSSITVASVLGVVALSLLEIFVAFLQSYIFVFLTALFIGMALHPEH